jgi:hypothetical protein
MQVNSASPRLRCAAAIMSLGRIDAVGDEYRDDEPVLDTARQELW